MLSPLNLSLNSQLKCGLAWGAMVAQGCVLSASEAVLRLG